MEDCEKDLSKTSQKTTSKYSFTMIQPNTEGLYSHRIQGAILFIEKDGSVIAELQQNDIMKLLLTTGMVGKDATNYLNGWTGLEE